MRISINSTLKAITAMIMAFRILCKGFYAKPLLALSQLSHYLRMELLERKLTPNLSSIQYFMGFVSKLLLIAFMKFLT